MKFSKLAANLTVLGASLISVSFASVLDDLNPGTAFYDSDVKGIVNDQGNGPGTAGNQSGVPLIENTGTNTHASGFTFYADFTPVASDLTGTRVLIELGGTASGTGLYLIGGVPTLLSKHGATATTTPESLNDTTLNSIAVQSSIGVLEEGQRYSFSASWNHAGTLELIASPAGGGEIFDGFTIAGVPGNWSGNDTLSVKELAINNAGGLARDNNNGIDPRFNTNDPSVASFVGEVHRAIFWNAHNVTPPVLTKPDVKGFSITRLPASGKIRLHWNISEGGLPNPTTAEIRETGATGGALLHSIAANSLVGFVDLETAVTDFTLVATNATGSQEATAAPEVETNHSSVIRQSSPLAWYRFNEAAGSRHLVDSSENAVPNNGEVKGQPLAGGQGFIDGAGDFLGSSTVLGRRVIDPGDLERPKGFTAEVVVKHSPGATDNQIIIAQQDAEGTGRVILGLRSDGRPYSFLGGVNRNATTALKPDTWAHVTLVVDPDGGQFRWYVNGQPAGVNAPTEGYDLESSSGGWVIGSAKNLVSTFFRGSVDEIAIYGDLLDDPDRNGDFSDSKVATHFQTWRLFSQGILRFDASANSVVTGDSVNLSVIVGGDVTSVEIDNGVGNVPLVNGVGTITLSPTETKTYTATATNGTGNSYTASTTVIFNPLTQPRLLGFEATSLPSTGQVRLHWLATPGDFATPTNVKLQWGEGEANIFESTSLRGHHDIPASQAANLQIEVSNLVGSITAEADAPAADTTHSATIRNAQPVAWYRFNEKLSSGLVVDSAENEKPHNGTLVNSVPVNNGATGFLDGAATFTNPEGVGGGVLTDLIIDPYTLEYGFTIEAIVETNPGTGTAHQVLVTQQDLEGTGRIILTVEDPGKLRSQVGGGAALYGTTPLPARAWSHLVAVVDVYKNEVRWYVDGQPAGTATPQNFFEASSGAWTIGVNKAMNANFWQGKIDDLIIYDKLLDDPNHDGDSEDSLVGIHRDAWWQRTSGVLFNDPENATIDAGGYVDLTIKAGGNVTGVTIDPNVGVVAIDGSVEGFSKGSAVVRLSPSQTTTYTITYQTDSGPVVRTITITVGGGQSEGVELRVTSTEISNGSFIIHYVGERSTTYLVRGSENLEEFSEDLGSTQTDSTGAGSVSIPIDPAKSRQFYRLESNR